MTEPIKLPPDLLAVTLVREGVNKHRARDIECWMNEKMAQAVESATGALQAEVERLREALNEIAISTHDDTAERVARAALKEPK
jgi:hypothetical protein